MGLIAKRILSMEESATLAMTQKANELKEQGVDVISLSIGEPDFNTPEFIKDAAKKALDDNFTHYPPVTGFTDVKQAVVKKLKRDNGLDYKTNQIVVSTGAKQALANAILCLVDAGDEVILPAPFWVSYTELIKFADGIPVIIETDIKSDFKATPEQIEAAITPKTKLIMFNSPNNPSGSIYSKEEIAAIVEVLKKYPDIYIISDEIYELINFSGKHTGFAEFPEIKDRVVIINGVSKGFSMTGWRLGYSVSSVEIAKAANKLQGQITSGTNTIAQKAALVALERDPKDVVELQEMTKKFRERRDLFYNALKEIPGLKLNLPEGAFYLFPEVDNYYGKSFNGKVIANDDDLCMYLLNEAHVATVAGGSFGNKNCIRLSYATDEASLIEAARRIKDALAALV
ncbi:pyridoxal phosphate-dependent aminotransferase [Bacteroidales bacterium OttesenSCG-928-J16]|nr:pyridoxal phosphate-dependent aminotransferase [Bacteroidales bacterium OttesenSCG-928-J16]